MQQTSIFDIKSTIVKDSRTINPGEAYIALKGENFDGHDFAINAIEKGASFVVVEKEIEGIDQKKQIIVPDTMDALIEIAKDKRAKSKAKFIGITGSSGKTSTKEMLKTALQCHGKTYATAGNLNNLIGLPLTLANMPDDCDFVILEMGMNHTGEIAELTQIARPDIAIVTNIGRAHHEFFPSSMDIARAKAEIFAGLSPEGVAIINGGEFSEFLGSSAQMYTDNIFIFGHTGDLRLLNYANNFIAAEIFGDTYEYLLKLNGEHHAMNSLAVLGAVAVLKQDIQKSILEICQMEPLKGRGQTLKLNTQIGQITLIDDAYNANPDSMIAAIKSLKPVAGRKIAVLGEMRELGEKGQSLHEEILPHILDAGVETLYCCGDNMKFLYDILPPEKQGFWAQDSKTLWQTLKTKIMPDDIIFVKGSLGSNMLYIIDEIKSMKQG